MSRAPHPTVKPTGFDEALVDGLCEITLETRDPEALEVFYTKALGLAVLSRDDDRIWLGCGPCARLGLWTPGEKEFDDEGGRHVHFAFSVTAGAVDATCEHLSTLGIEFRGPVEHPGGDRSLYLKDPEGNVVELWDFFQSGDGAAAGVRALAAADHS